MKQKLLFLVVVLVCGSQEGFSQDPPRRQLRASSPAAVEISREWDRGSETVVELSPEELKRREQAKERVLPIIQERIESSFQFNKGPGDSIRDWLDEAIFIKNKTYDYMNNNLLYYGQNREVYRAMAKETTAMFDQLMARTKSSNGYQFLPGSSNMAEVQEYRQMFDRWKAFMFDLAVQKWTEDMNLRF